MHLPFAGVPSSKYFLLNSNLVYTALLAGLTRLLDLRNAAVTGSKFQTSPSYALLPAYCTDTYSALT